MTEELISFASKQEMLAKSKQFWNPDKTQFWIDSGVPLVIDRREGYFIYDVEGKRLIDVHLNGGTYNLGHRNPEVSAAAAARRSTSRSRPRGTRPKGARSSRSPRPTTATPAWPSPPATTGSRPC